MYLYDQLREHAGAGRPVRVGLIGAGKFGSMFLSQAPSAIGLEVRVIADLDPDRARAACRAVGWSDARVAATRFTDDALEAVRDDTVDVVVEATGDPAAGIAHARAAFSAGRHIVMVNVEAGRAGRALARRRGAGGGRRLHDGLRRSARAHLRAGGVGPLVRLRRRGGGGRAPSTCRRITPRRRTRCGSTTGSPPSRPRRRA